MGKTDLQTEVMALRKQVADLKEAAAVRRRLENAIRDALELTRTTLEDCPIPLARLDQQGRLVLGNSALARFLGYVSRSELMELNPVLGLFADPSQQPGILEALEADPDGFAEMVGVFRTKEGDARPAMLRVKKVSSPDGYLFGVLEPASS